MTHVATRGVASAASARRAAVPGFHMALVVMMTMIVLLGFWPFYAGLVTGNAGAPAIIYAHAAVFSGWLVLLLAQTWLVYRRRVGVHQRVGRFGILYGIGVLLFGAVISFVVPAMNVTNGTMTLDEAAGFLVLPIGDMLLFGGFFVAGVIRRRDREAHRRLMILAAVALIFPGAARFASPAGPAAILGVWLLPLFAAMLHDAWVLRRVHRLYWLGAAIFLVAFGRVALMEAEPWLVIGRRVITALLPAGFQA
jgi:uncharacterized membrane protein YozB (DUF420 family)